MIKQVIVMRKDLKMRRGKEIAQGCHASMAAITNLMFERAAPTGEFSHHEVVSERGLFLRNAHKYVREWLDGKFTKICLVVDTEAELHEIHNKARLKGMHGALIQDAGLTEFGGVPTYTCCSIGPWDADEINEITGHLKPY